MNCYIYTSILPCQTNTCLYPSSVQEKVDSLTERVERESVAGERVIGIEETDGASTKGGIKTKCKYLFFSAVRVFLSLFLSL